MTQQTRMLIILGAFGFGAAIVLMGMANRYGKILEKRLEEEPRSPAVADRSRAPEAATGRLGEFSSARFADVDITQALALVDAFIEVRRAVSDRIDREAPAKPGTPGRDLSELREARDAAARRAGLQAADYLAVRERYREWKSGGGGSGQDRLLVALQLRAAKLNALDLGDYERYDL